VTRDVPPGWLRLRPRTIVDVGAAFGDWAARAREVNSDARLILVEPLEEYRPILEPRLGPLRAEYVEAAAAAESGTATINVHADLVGSSLYLEGEEGVNGEPREVRAVTVDELAPAGPVLLKIDAQGAELDVLEGARETLAGSCGVLLELSLFRFFAGGPLAHEAIAYMAERGFVLYDLHDVMRRPLDDAVSQFNALFVPGDSELRARHVYADRESRRKQDAVLREHYAKRLSG